MSGRQKDKSKHSSSKRKALKSFKSEGAKSSKKKSKRTSSRTACASVENEACTSTSIHKTKILKKEDFCIKSTSMNWNDSVETIKMFDQVESDEEFEHFLSSLPEAVMDGSKPLPNEIGHILSKTSNVSLTDFPDHILESIFSCLPGADMLDVCTCVCRSWKSLIEKEIFMPWKKLYLKVRNNDAEAYSHVKFLSCPVLFDETQAGEGGEMKKSIPLATLIRLLQAWKPTGITKKDSDQTLKSLQTHELFQFADELARKRVLNVKKKRCTKSHCWAVAGTILCLSTTAGELERLRNCLLTVHSLKVVMDFFYMAAVCAWVLFKEKLMSQELHYKLFCSISSVENATFPKPITFGFRPDPAAERLTYEQLRVASHRFRRGEVVRVIAYAGTGKTTTLVSCVRANPNLKFLYTSFGKAVVEQSKQVFCGLPNMDFRTMHSLAYWGMNMNNFRSKLNHGSFRAGDVREKLSIPSEDKQLPSLVIKTIHNFLASKDRGITRSHVPRYQRTQGSSKRTQMVEISVERKKYVLKLSKTFWRRTCDLTDCSWLMIDDCYLKLWQMSSPVIDGYDVILLDEAQDCTECMRGILEEQLGRCALVLVGDSHQQIYGFRRASDALVTMPASHSYYLTQSFRFGQDIALVADTILRAFKFDANGDELLVSDKTLLGVGEAGSVCGQPGAGQVAILCRSNLGVIRQVLASLKAEPTKKVAVVGGAEKLGLELMMDLYALSKPISARKSLGLKVVRQSLRKYKSLKEVATEATLTEDEAMLSKIEIVNALGDELPKAVETLKERRRLYRVWYADVLLGDRPYCLLAEMTNLSLPRDMSKADKVVSTVHKAKGLEFDTVHVCDDYAKNLVKILMAGSKLSKYLKEEANLLYVAATRAKKSLVMSDALCELLQFKKIHFLTPRKTSSLNDESLYCARCKAILPTHTVVTLSQPSIARMQDEGPLCQKCGALLAPGWGCLLGEPDEIASGMNQTMILKKQGLSRLGAVALDPSDDEDDEMEAENYVIVID